jgi:hypothetical protein
MVPSLAYCPVNGLQPIFVLLKKIRTAILLRALTRVSFTLASLALLI